MKKHHAAHRLFWGTLFLGALLIMTPSASMAQTPVGTGVEAGFTEADTLLIENLNALVGSRACILLNSGISFCGVVRQLRGGLIHIGQIQEREYNNMLVRVSDISAVGAHFRAQPQQE